MEVKAAWDVKLTAQGYVDLYIHSPVCLRGVVLDYLSTGTTLPFLVYFTHYFSENLVAPEIEPGTSDLYPGTLITTPQGRSFLSVLQLF
jgi:hypothetical protein